MTRNDSRSPISRRMRSAICLLRARQLQPLEELVRVADGQRRQLGDALAAHLDEARLLAQPRAVALLAGGLRHVAVELFVGGLEVLVGRAPLLAAAPLVLVEAPLEVGQHAFELLLEVVLARPLFSKVNSTSSPPSPRGSSCVLRGQLVPRRVHVDLVVGRRPPRGSAGRRARCASPRDRWRPRAATAPRRGRSDRDRRTSWRRCRRSRGRRRRVVEREHARRDLGVADAAGDAGELVGEEQVARPRRAGETLTMPSASLRASSIESVRRWRMPSLLHQRDRRTPRWCASCSCRA